MNVSVWVSEIKNFHRRSHIERERRKTFEEKKPEEGVKGNFWRRAVDYRDAKAQKSLKNTQEFLKWTHTRTQNPHWLYTLHVSHNTTNSLAMVNVVSQRYWAAARRTGERFLSAKILWWLCSSPDLIAYPRSTAHFIPNYMQPSYTLAIQLAICALLLYPQSLCISSALNA